MVKKKRRIIEMVEFKVKQGREEEDIKKSSDKAQKFYEKQPGFEHRLLLRTKNKNQYFEQVQWRNEDHAKIARKEAESSEECKDFLGIISKSSVKISHPELVKMY